MLTLLRARHFVDDFDHRVRWYIQEAGPEVASRFEEAIDVTLQKLIRQPTLGHPQHFRHATLKDLRSFSVVTPFGKHLVFYRVDEREGTLEAWRLMHGARNLSRRLLEPND